MSDVTFGGLTFTAQDTFIFDILPVDMDKVIVTVGSSLADNDVALSFANGGVSFNAAILLFQDVSKTAMEKYRELKALEGTVSTLEAVGETIPNVVLVSGGRPKKEITDGGFIVSFAASFRRLAE